jgi:hypothetical protein
VRRSPDPERIASDQNWIEFEGFSNRIFSSFGFKTLRNYRMKKPRMEIDLVAFGNGLSFAVDCKHWKRTVGPASMTKIAEKQVIRARRMALDGQFGRVIPVILTWRDESLYVLDSGVPIVPIHRLSDFILNWEESGTPIVVFEPESTQKVLPHTG